MPTGNINLTFETPDINLTGTGEFDISETFKNLFINNPAIQESISDKINEIFNNIQEVEVGKNWADKIKKAFNIKPGDISLTDALQKKAEDYIKNLKFNMGELSVAAKSSIKEPLKGKKTVEGLDNFPLMSKDFQKYIKFFTTDVNLQNYFKTFSNSGFKNFIATFPKTMVDSIKSITSSSISPSIASDSIFEQTMNVNIEDISDNVLDKLEILFKGEAEKKKKTVSGDMDIEKPEKGFIGKLIDNLLKGMGIAGGLSLLKGLAGPALLAGGLIMMALDGIAGWFKAEEWGVSQLAGAIGAAFGGTGSGVDGAIHNAIKGGLIGGGIGLMVGGPVGFIAGSLVGAAIGGILGWLGGETLAKKIDDVNKNISTWFNKNIDEYMNESVLKRFGHASGIISLGNEAEDTTRELRKGFFDAFIFTPLKSWINKFSVKSMTTVLSSLEAGFDTSDVAQTTIKGLQKAGAKGLSKLAISRILKYIPGVSIVFGIVEAIDYFRQGNIISGLIALGSGIAGVVPGWGTAISLMLDAANIGLNGTETGKLMKADFNLKIDKFIEFLKYIPGLGSLVYFAEGFGILAGGGDISKVLMKFAVGIAQIIPGAGALIVGLEKKVSAKMDANPTKSLGDVLAEGMLNQFEKYPKWMKYILAKMGIPLKNSDDLFNEEALINSGNEARKPNDERYKAEKLGRVQQTQAAIVSPKSITFQPANEDKLYTQGDTSIFAKPDDILGKTFTNIDKKLQMLTNAVMATNVVLNNHTIIFKDMFNISNEQLKFLPALKPIPQQMPENQTRFPNSDTRDPAYEYRVNIHNNIRQGY